MIAPKKVGAAVAAVGLVGVFTVISVSGTTVVEPAVPDTGWPSEATTGVPDGVTLTQYSGPLTITSSGVTNIDSKQIGTAASPVTLTIARSAGTVNITNSRVWGAVEITCSDASLGAGTPLVHCPSSTPYLNMTDSEVQQQSSMQDQGVGYENFHLVRVEINGGRRSFNCETDAIVEDSLMHGIADDPTGVAHQSTGRMSQGCDFIGNVFECTANDYPPDAGCSADMTGYGDFETVADNLIENNLFKATQGGYCAYGGTGGGKAYPNAHDIRFIDNVFERRADSQSGVSCGYYGTISNFNTSGTGNVWTNNTYTDGAPVTP